MIFTGLFRKKKKEELEPSKEESTPESSKEESNQ